MRNGFAWVGRSFVLGALLAGSFGVGGAIAEIKRVKKIETIEQMVQIIKQGRDFHSKQFLDIPILTQVAS